MRTTELLNDDKQLWPLLNKQQHSVSSCSLECLMPVMDVVCQSVEITLHKNKVLSSMSGKAIHKYESFKCYLKQTTKTKSSEGQIKIQRTTTRDRESDAHKIQKTETNITTQI